MREIINVYMYIYVYICRFFPLYIYVCISLSVCIHVNENCSILRIFSKYNETTVYESRKGSKAEKEGEGSDTNPRRRMRKHGEDVVDDG